MMRRLNIGLPSPFFAYSDERSFFSWLKRIKAVRTVKGTPNGLIVSVVEPIDDGSLMDLIALLTRYSMDSRCLSSLCNSGNQKWFKRSGTFWFKKVFGRNGKLRAQQRRRRT